MMETKRIITTKDAEAFFNTSVNTLEDSVGKAVVNRHKKSIIFDFLLLQFPHLSVHTIRKLSY